MIENVNVMRDFRTYALRKSFLKRITKAMCKSFGIKKHEAYTRISKQQGFQSWNHFAKEIKNEN